MGGGGIGQHVTARGRNTKRWENFTREGLERDKAQLYPPVSGRPAPYPGKEGNASHPF